MNERAEGITDAPQGIGRASRKTVRRTVITGTLILETPACFGNGDVDGLTDVPLLRDPLEGKPLLTGASIAGSLRNYLWEVERGYGQEEDPKEEKSLAQRLFGHLDESNHDKRASVQSWLLVDNAFGETPGFEIRDGVALDPKTRTAFPKRKFDLELLQAGTRFNLSFELLLKEGDDDLLDGLGYALHGLETGAIGLGQRKKRGLGQCRAGNWLVCTYDLTDTTQLIQWLEDNLSRAETGDEILKLVKPRIKLEDKRECFTLKAEFELENSLLIRSSSGEPDSPDMVHLRSQRMGQADPVPILSGTSLAGALRARALRIANTIGLSNAPQVIDDMFGRHIEGRGDEPTGSRVVTRETMLQNTRDLVQSRVKIDRFTGGSYPQALFTQQPAFGGNGNRVNIHVSIRNPKDAEIGLFLLILKDLWTADLPLGGEISVGRGRLRGVKATLCLKENGSLKTWEIAQQPDHLKVTSDHTPKPSKKDPKAELEEYVQALYRKEST